MNPAVGRRTLLSLLGAASLLPLGSMRALAAPAAPRVRRIKATPSREVEVTSWQAAAPRRGTIAFSHGFGSSPRFYPDFVQAWTMAGYDVIAPLHVDSREYPNAGAFTGSAGWAARIEDMRAVAAVIEGPFVAAGHSFGALTALVLGGAAAIIPPGIKGPLSDSRVTCAIAFSPPAPMPALITEAGYAKLARPALIQTGTRDMLPSLTPDPEGWRGHFAAFSNSPSTDDHYGLVLEGVDHYFGGLICDPSKTGPDQRSGLKLAADASLAFLARYAVPGSGLARKGAAQSTRPAFPIDSAARFYQR